MTLILIKLIQQLFNFIKNYSNCFMILIFCLINIKKIKKKYIKLKSSIEFTYENIVLSNNITISVLKEFKKGGKYDK